MMRNGENGQMTMGAAEIAKYLGVSLQSAYNLLHSATFPAFRVGKRLLVHRDDFEVWLVRQREKGA